MNRFPMPYSTFITDNFEFKDHTCEIDCNCDKLGCTKHYIYLEGNPPDKEQARYMLATWQAFRTPSRNGVFLMEKCKSNDTTNRPIYITCS